MYKRLNSEIKIHLHDRNGMYTVVSYTDHSMELCTKYSDTFHVPLKKFKCLAGGRWNYNARQIHNDELQEFLKVVDPTSIGIDENFNLNVEEFLKQVKDYEDNYEEALARQQEEMAKILQDEAYNVPEEVYEHAYDDDAHNNRDYVDDYDDTNSYDYAPLSYEELESSRDYWQMKSLDLETVKDAIIKKVGMMYLSAGFNAFPLPTDGGLKFVYQESEDIGDSRILLDPLRILPNYHSNIAKMFGDGKYYTINGGWLQYDLETNTITLYGESSDYGRYNPDLCIPLFEKLYPSIKIISLPE